MAVKCDWTYGVTIYYRYVHLTQITQSDRTIILPPRGIIKSASTVLLHLLTSPILFELNFLLIVNLIFCNVRLYGQFPRISPRYFVASMLRWGNFHPRTLSLPQLNTFKCLNLISCLKIWYKFMSSPSYWCSNSQILLVTLLFCQDRPLLFSNLRQLGFGLKDSLCSKSKPLVTVTPVHIFNFYSLASGSVPASWYHSESRSVKFPLVWIIYCHKNHLFAGFQ